MNQSERAGLIERLIIQEARELMRLDPELHIIMPVIKLTENPDYSKSARFDINCY